MSWLHTLISLLQHLSEPLGGGNHCARDLLQSRGTLFAALPQLDSTYPSCSPFCPETPSSSGSIETPSNRFFLHPLPFSNELLQSSTKSGLMTLSAGLKHFALTAENKRDGERRRERALPYHCSYRKKTGIKEVDLNTQRARMKINKVKELLQPRLYEGLVGQQKRQQFHTQNRPSDCPPPQLLSACRRVLMSGAEMQ